MITTAVIPVAGFGTRMLPASKSTPKELLPLADKPMIHYIINECHDAGIRHVILVNHASKTSLEDYFGRNHELEDSLKKSHKDELLEEIRNVLPKGMTISTVRQNHPLGLGHAVLAAKEVVGKRPFAVLLPDVLVERDKQKGSQTDLSIMIKEYVKTQSSQILVEPVEQNKIPNYGIIDGEIEGNSIRLSNIIEKPSIDKAPSNLAVVGRYVFSSTIWKQLEKTTAGAGNEIQLSDAIKDLLTIEDVFAVTLKGDTYDCGCKLGYYQAFIEKALNTNQTNCVELENFVMDMADKIKRHREQDKQKRKHTKEASIVQLFG